MLLFYTPAVFALSEASPYPYVQQDALKGQINIIGDHLKLMGPNTGVFQYKIKDKNGKDITSKVSPSDLYIQAFVGDNIWDPNITKKAQASFEPRTGTCTLTCDFSNDNDHYVTVDLGLRYCGVDSKSLIIRDLPKDIKVDELKFVSDALTKTGTNKATFQYKVIHFIDDVTKEIPASQIDAFASLDSNVTLDPSTGTGTITFNSQNSDTDQTLKITLTDKLTGVTAILITTGLGQNPVKTTTSSAISRINFVSGDLIKTGEDTATFQYKILDHHYSDITKTIPVTDLEATAIVSTTNGAINLDSATDPEATAPVSTTTAAISLDPASNLETTAPVSTTKAAINLDPATGLGTITYNFADTDKQIMVNIIHKKGLGVSAQLNIVSSESDNNEADTDNNMDDIQIAQIAFVPTDMVNPGHYAELQYEILNKYGKDITNKIPASQLAVSSSVNSMISLVPKDRTYKITYDFRDSDKTIIVSLADKLTGVKTTLNIGNAPEASDTDSSTTDSSSDEIMKYKESVSE